MDRDDIIRMAREAGMREGESGDWTAADAALTYPECVYTNNLERFAHLVAAAEREACAALCDKISDEDGFEGGYANYCAHAIRERGAS